MIEILKKNRTIPIIAVIILVIALIAGTASGIVYYLCGVQFVGDNNDVGDISKDENDDVWAYGIVTLYNGNWKDKKIVFEADNEDVWILEDSDSMKDEKYEITKIEIVSGNGQVDEENMVLIIPANETVTVRIDTNNVWTDDEYKGEAIGLYRQAPHISFRVVK